MKSPLLQRQSGILLHPSSLPCNAPDTCGNFGSEARKFIDFLVKSGFGLWQVLPLGPVDKFGSPYHSSSVFAGNSALISIEELSKSGLDISKGESCNRHSVMQSAYLNSQHAPKSTQTAYQKYIEDNEYWLTDYALFRSIQHRYPKLNWSKWPSPLRNREPAALNKIQTQSEIFNFVLFEQFIFAEQWQALRLYANAQGISLMGDAPLFVAHNSADVWSHQNLFALDETGQAISVAGVPPDYFSETGQRWGNPQYRWDIMSNDNFRWWRERIKHLIRQFDLIRIDHFRGLEAYWDIPASCETACEGHWVKAPGRALLDSLARDFQPLPLIAEDLGLVTPEVEKLRDDYALPGMKILQFAFDSDDSNPYLPHNHIKNSIIYTGTHDNDTSLGWFNSLNADSKQRVLNYLGKTDNSIPRAMLTAALASIAQLAVIPMQDLLELGSEDRMNTPGVCEGNWSFSFNWAQLPPGLSNELRHLNQKFQRN